MIGPNAADVHVGGYGREPGHGVSILDGIRERVGYAAKVVYAEGCQITEGQQGWRGWVESNVKLADPKAQVEKVAAAAELARKADVAILVVGENESTNREAWAENHLGDRDSLDLLGAQNDLVKAIVETGKPTVVLLINGRPLSINYVAEHVPAILEGWYLGQEGGTAAANVFSATSIPAANCPSRSRIPWALCPISTITNRATTAVTYSAPGSRSTRSARGSVTPRSNSTTCGSSRRKSRSPASPRREWISPTPARARATRLPQLYMHQRVASVTQPVMELSGFRAHHPETGRKAHRRIHD